jgi:hypothetical protein
MLLKLVLKGPCCYSNGQLNAGNGIENDIEGIEGRLMDGNAGMDTEGRFIKESKLGMGKETLNEMEGIEGSEGNAGSDGILTDGKCINASKLGIGRAIAKLRLGIEGSDNVGNPGIVKFGKLQLMFTLSGF